MKQKQDDTPISTVTWTCRCGMLSFAHQAYCGRVWGNEAACNKEGGEEMTEIIYDCSGLASCAADGRSCLCPRRLASHAPFIWADRRSVRSCGGHAIQDFGYVDLPISNPPCPKLWDLLRAMGVQGV